MDGRVDGRRRARRGYGIAALLLAIGLGALTAACGSEGGSAQPTGADVYVLPPEGVDVVGATGGYGDPTSPDPDPAEVSGYLIRWRTDSGDIVGLDAARSGSMRVVGDRPGRIEFEPPNDVDGLVDAIETVFTRMPFDASTFRPVDDGPLDPAVSYCVGVTEARTDLLVLGTVGSSLVIVSGGPPGEDGLRATPPCDELRRDSAVLRASRELRVVDEATWRAFMDEHGELRPVTTTTTTPPPTLDPAVVDYCDAIERFRGAGLSTDPETSALGPDALPYLEDIRDAAPADARAALQTVIDWLKDGAPEPAPEEVNGAYGPMMSSWLAHCQLTNPGTPSPTIGP